MTDKFRTDIILVISSRRGIISVAIGGRGSRGTNEVTIRIVIIVVFRISTTIVVVVVAVGIIIDVIFGFFVIGINDGVILGVAFGCSCRVRASGKGTVIIRSRVKKMMIVAFEIIINVVFGIVIAVVVVIIVSREESTLSSQTPTVGIIIVRDKDKGPIIVGNRVLDTAVTIIVEQQQQLFLFIVFTFKLTKRGLRETHFFKK